MHKTVNINLLIFLVISLISIGQAVDIYLPSMPFLVNAFSTSTGNVQLSMTVALIGFGFSTIVYGPLSDYYGRRIIALTGLSLFLIGSLVCVFSDTIFIFLLGRSIQGLGIGCAGAVSAPILKDTLTGSQLVRAFSFVSIAMAIAPIIAPLLGGYFQEYIGWQANFVFLTAYSGLVLILFYSSLPETLQNLRKSRLSLPKIIMDYISILIDKKTLAYLICFMAIFSGEIAYCTVLPFLVQKTLGFSAIANGWLMIFTAAGLVVGGFISSCSSKFFDIEKLVIFSLVLILLGSIVMLILGWLNYLNIYVVVGPMTLYMIGTGIAYPNLIAGIMNAHPDKSGTTASLMSSLQMFAAGGTIIIVSNLAISTQIPLSWVITSTSLIAVIAYKILLNKYTN